MNQNIDRQICVIGLGVLCAALTTPTFGQVELSILTAGDAAAGDNFGNAAAISGDTVIVGAVREGPPSLAGAAYIFQQNGESWDQQAKLVASDRATFDEFGFSVGLSGNWAVVGSWQDNHSAITSGSAYVFERVGSTWFQRQKLVAADRAAGDEFGAGVAIDGDTMVIGADQNFTNSTKSGVAYVYRLNAGVWTQQAKLIPPDGSAADAFGRSVAIHGDTILIGAPNEDPAASPISFNSGAAYVFHRTGVTWTFQGKLVANDAAAGDRTALCVSINGDTAVLGSELDDDAGVSSGSAYVFQRSGSTWSQQAKLTASDAFAGNSFGSGVAVNGNAIVIGSYLNGSGSAYIFRHDGSNWIEESNLSPSTVNGNHQFGRGAVALSSDQLLVVGAPVDTHSGTGSGAAFVFDINGGGDTDSDGDGLSDAEEAILGTDPFNSDSDGDTVGDGLEVEIAAGLGCPDPLNADSDSDGLSDGYELEFGPNPCNGDVDGDGLNDGDEVAAGTNPNNSDTDADGINDGAEVNLGTNPLNPDTDGDGLIDGLELAFGANPLNPDTDGDGLSDGQEVSLANNTGCPNPVVADSDGDGLNDGAEHAAGLSPCDADTDHDGLSDGNEPAHGTNPLNPDTDGDGLLDGYEVTLAAGGSCPSPLNPDSDNDGVTDGNELTAGLGPCDNDSDNDGLSDGNELAFGTNPMNPDSDNDGLLDGTEIDMAGGAGCPNPLVADSDGDTLADGPETMAGMNPCALDTDGDGFNDNIDPTPTNPGVPANYLANITQAVAGGVANINQALFLGPNANTRIARRTVLAVDILAASVAIKHNLYGVARVLLTVADRKVDGQSSPTDWMGPSPAQSTLHSDLQTILFLVDILD